MANKSTQKYMPPLARKRHQELRKTFKPEIDTSETEEQAAMRQEQMSQLAKLNDEQNRKLKRLLGASQGMRAFRGSAMSRGTPGNRTGGGSRSLVPAYGGAVFSAGAGGGARSGGGSGGRTLVAY